MSDDASSGMDLSVLRARLRPNAATSVAERKAREKRALSPSDGRRLRVSERSVQVNLRVTPEFKATLLELARLHGCTMTEVVESAVAQLAAKGTEE